MTAELERRYVNDYVDGDSLGHIPGPDCRCGPTITHTTPHTTEDWMWVTLAHQELTWATKEAERAATAAQVVREYVADPRDETEPMPWTLQALLAEYDRRGRILRDIGGALAANDDRENFLGLLFVEFGMDRAREIMSALRDQIET